MDFYPSTGAIEIDLRQEFHETLFGAHDEIPKGQIVIFRRMRRKTGIVYPSEEADLLASPAVNPYTHQGPSSNYPDNWAFGEKFLFDDQLIKIYRSYPVMVENMNNIIAISPGAIPTGVTYFYMEHWVMPSIYDKIVELVIDQDGIPVSPLKKFVKYSIKSAEKFRSDNGRICYWRCT